MISIGLVQRVEPQFFVVDPLIGRDDTRSPPALHGTLSMAPSELPACKTTPGPASDSTSTFGPLVELDIYSVTKGTLYHRRMNTQQHRLLKRTNVQNESAQTLN